MSQAIASVLRKYGVSPELIVDLFGVVGGDREAFYKEAGIDGAERAHAPALSADDGLKLSPIERVERDTVYALIGHMARRDFTLIGVDIDYRMHSVASAREALELVFKREQEERVHAAVYFRKNGGIPHAVVLDVYAGYNIIGNHTYGYRDEDGFSAAVDAFKSKETQS